jgi:hypothetical protein
MIGELTKTPLAEAKTYFKVNYELISHTVFELLRAGVNYVSDTPVMRSTSPTLSN